MRNYFEEMNIDYDELKRYEDIETYYDEVQDYTKLIKELQCDRVEALKQIVNKNREIERLNNIIKESAEEILKKLEENHHLSYGVALSIRQKLLDYRELKGSDKNDKS